MKLGEGLGADSQCPELRAARLCVACEAYELAGEHALAVRLAEEALALARGSRLPPRGGAGGALARRA